MGPYTDKGLAYTKDGGKGHNVTAIALPDGRIALIVCETVPFQVFTASDPNGPFEYQGSPQINTNGHNIGGAKLASNMSICMRDDGTFLIVTRDGFVLHSTTGILGPYLVKTDKIWPMNLPGYNTANWEDPVIWRSGKKYYCTVNSWSSKKAIYLTSDDGLTNWKYTGDAYSPLNQNMLRYINGRKNIWCKMERPGVYVENGILTYLTWAVIDTEKEADLGNDTHNSKIIVVPFDGASFDGTTGVRSGSARDDSKQRVLLAIKNTATVAGKTWTIPSGLFEEGAMVDIKVYDVGGRLAARIRNVRATGMRIVFNDGDAGNRLGSGMYLAALRNGRGNYTVHLAIP
jgi:hypothetical protein